MATRHEQRKEARNLFAETPLTQKEISVKVGVSDKTIGTWIKQGNWQRKGEASTIFLSDMREIIQRWIKSMQIKITNEGRNPSLNESQTLHMLTRTLVIIEKGRDYETANEVFEKFTSFINSKDAALTKKFTEYWTYFLQTK